MKTARLLLGLLAGLQAIAFAQITPASPSSYSGNLVNFTGLASTKTAQVDMAAYQGSRLSAQMVYSSTTFTAATFTDGQQATGTVTVVDYTQLSSAAAVDYLTVLSTAGINGKVITLQSGVNTFTFNVAASSNTQGQAHALAAQMNGTLGISALQLGTSVQLTAPYGTAANLYFLTSNTASITVVTAQLTGGRDNAVLTINGTALTQGVDWTAATSSGATASSLAAAIQNNAATNAIVTISTGAIPGNTIAITSIFTGAARNYVTTSSTQTYLSAPPALAGGITGGVALSSQLLTSTNTTGLTLGLAVLYATNTQTGSIGGLTNQTTYFAVPVGPYTFDLAKYSTSAIAGLTSDFVTVTSTNAGTSIRTYSLTPLPSTAILMATVTWQTSDNATNWVSSGTVNIASNTAAGDTLYDFGFLNLRYLRLNIVPASQGGINLTVPVYIKQDGSQPK